MSQPVKLSDSLVLDARLTGKIAERSISGQIEFWAGLGRVVEQLLRGKEVLALRKNGAFKPVSESLAEAGTAAGQQLVTDYLKSQPYPHYEMAPGKPGAIIRSNQDGTRTIGRFVNRQFVPTRAHTSTNASAA